LVHWDWAVFTVNTYNIKKLTFMIRITGAGPYLYAIALAAFALIQLVTQNFLTCMLQVPAVLPLRSVWVDLSSVVWLVAAAGIFFRRWRQTAAVVAGALFLVFFLCLGLPKLLGDLYNPNEWTPPFEAIMLGSGGFIIAANFLGEWSIRDPKWIRFGAMAGLYLFAMCLIIFAVLHIRYNDYIITLMPVWVPGKEFMSYVVIAGFLLSAFCLFTNIKVRLAMWWLGIMYLLWVGVLHAPRAIGRLTVEAEWSSLFVALACAGIAFSIYHRAIDVGSGRIGRLAAVPI
jgi:hypothetical protein